MRLGLTLVWRLLLAVWFGLACAAQAAEPAVPTVGIEGKVEVLLPGTALKTIPTDLRAPLTLRIAGTRPHGTLISYDLRYIGLVPGTYDLRKYLAREDGTATADLPPIEVRIVGVLPPEHAGQLAAREEQRIPALGGYTWLMIGLGVTWLVFLIPLWMSGRKKAAVAKAGDSIAPRTIADRLRPLVTRAAAGSITVDEKAELERLLLAHWRERLHLDEHSPAAAMAALRAHPEAGIILRTLEDWLHRRPGTAEVDVERFLEPYAQTTAATSPASA